MKKTFIHIEAGDDNWTPTSQELSGLVRHLRKTLAGTTPDDTAVFATRNGVKLTVVEYDPYTYTTTSNGQNT